MADEHDWIDELVDRRRERGDEERRRSEESEKQRRALRQALDRNAGPLLRRLADAMRPLVERYNAKFERPQVQLEPVPNGIKVTKTKYPVGYLDIAFDRENGDLRVSQRYVPAEGREIHGTALPEWRMRADQGGELEFSDGVRTVQPSEIATAILKSYFSEITSQDSR
jgi:hypothetical protein